MAYKPGETERETYPESGRDRESANVETKSKADFCKPYQFQCRKTVKAFRSERKEEMGESFDGESEK